MFCVLQSLFFFFFKQKTAYEMRISDWSSDVCSSDLDEQCARRRDGDDGRRNHPAWRPPARPGRSGPAGRGGRLGGYAGDRDRGYGAYPAQAGGCARAADRLEEHTSELQSLMRTSYAVFCWKKKTNQPHNTPDAD